MWMMIQIALILKHDISLSHKNVHVLQDLVNSKLVDADMLMRQNKLSIKYASQCTC